MMGTKHLALAIVLAFCAGVCWSAQAQATSITDKTKLQAIEISPGIEDREKGVVNGAAYLGKTSGGLPGSFFMSLNYSTGDPASLPPLSAVNSVEGGTWSLPVYRSDEYLGAIYGRVVEGTIDWGGSKTLANLNITLSVDGGTQKLAGMIGKGYFIGTLDRAVRGKPWLSGDLIFELQQDEGAVGELSVR